jgi:hypothetical protein
VTPQETALSRLLAAAPGFRPTWRGSLEAPKITEAIGQLVEYLGAEEVRNDELGAVLLVAEQLLQPGEAKEEVRVAIELIEDLQLLASFPDARL